MTQLLCHQLVDAFVILFGEEEQYYNQSKIRSVNQMMIDSHVESPPNSIQTAQTFKKIDLHAIINRHQQMNHLKCNCKCSCANTSSDEIIDPVQKKRLKRKQNKKKLKNRHREQKQKAEKYFQTMVKRIYSLDLCFDDCQPQITELLQFSVCAQKYLQLVNSQIRKEIEMFRDRIYQYLGKYQQYRTEMQIEQIIIPQIFQQFYRIQMASPQLEKLINSLADGNKSKQVCSGLDRITFKFILKKQGNRTTVFEDLCHIVFEDDRFTHEREVLNYMMDLLQSQPEDLDEDYEDEQDEDSQRSDLNQFIAQNHIKIQGYPIKFNDKAEIYDEIETQIIEEQQIKEQKTKRRRKKKKMEEEFDHSYEAVYNRIESLSIDDSSRINCNVSEEWLERARNKSKIFRKQSKSFE